MERIQNLIVRWRSSLWLMPAVIALLASLLAVVLLSLPPQSIATDGPWWWLFAGDADTARSLLGTLTSAMITMTSLVVSITVVVLTLAANQLGPRLVVNFMGDRQIQAILGLFIGTILYLITVLRSVSGGVSDDNLPHVAVTVGSALSAVCLFALLFYVHKAARSIIADTVINEVADALDQAIGDNLVEPGEAEETCGPWPRGGPEQWVALDRGGYIQVIDHGALVALAAKHDLLIRLEARAGNFVLARGHHALVVGACSEDIGAEIADAFVLGPTRSPTQDVEYAIRQLVEIALRALSPGINDPFTANAAIDRLAAALAEILRRDLPAKVHTDESGAVRVLAAPMCHGDLVDGALNQIRQAGSGNAAVLIQIARRLGDLMPLARNADQRDALVRHLTMVERAAERTLPEPNDLADLRSRVGAARAALSGSPPHAAR